MTQCLENCSKVLRGNKKCFVLLLRQVLIGVMNIDACPDNQRNAKVRWVILVLKRARYKDY